MCVCVCVCVCARARMFVCGGGGGGGGLDHLTKPAKAMIVISLYVARDDSEG